MTNNAVGELGSLLEEMRVTNVARGLKVNVHEEWIQRLERAYNALKAEVPQLKERIAELEELSSSPALVQEVATKVSAGKRK